MKYWSPEEFDELAEAAYKKGFTHVASGPLVRSSYHADQMAHDSGLVDIGS
jgi:lipoic acid synthetase